MRPYLAILRTRFLLLLQYRAAALAGLCTQIFFGFVRVMILTAFVAARPGSSPMSVPQLVTYVWLGQAMLTLLPWSLDNELRAMIRSGAVAYELLRPVDLYGVWFFRCVAQRLAPMLLRAVPMFVIAISFFGMGLPDSVGAGVAWAVATVASVLLAAALTTVMTITLMWTVAGEGAARLLPALAYFGCGLVIPIPMFPEWARRVLDFLPFRGIMDAPFRLYSGHIRPEDAVWVVGHQLAWTVGLVVLGRWMLGRGLRRLVVQGG